MRPENRKGNGERELKRARQALEAAREELTAGRMEDATSRAYYAIFHTSRAALMARDIQTKKHRHLLSKFSETFIESGLLPEYLKDTLHELFEKRNVADYGWGEEPEKILTPEVTARLVADAETFVSEVEAWVRAEWERND